MNLKIFLPLYKYYDIDEMHDVGIPNKNKSLSLFHINTCCLRKILMIFNIFNMC